ncbi:MAG: hypothetical protein IT326_03250 [Anaerolineae bacterium]|nr:hypothetical protein [Anaerolineae bacterium]MCC6904832.1 hypothetical protein [Anaerolineae bacterium]
MKRKSLIAMFSVVVLALAVSVAPVFGQSEGTIGGVVFEDLNGNGLREEGENGLRDIEVKLASSGWNTTVSTAENGSFGVRLNPATWQVTVLAPTGFKVTTSETQNAFIGQAGDAVTNLEFGLQRTVSATGEVLPASGGPVSTGVLIGGLVALIAVGAGLVVAGQRRGRQSA